MKYKNLLFDVDDTLLDFQDAQKGALKSLFESMDIPYNEETEKMYNTMNQTRWRQFEQGILTSEQVVNGRFGIFFNQLGIEVDSVEMERNYRQYLKEGIKPVENSLELVNSLSKQANLYIVTNGIAETQSYRLQKSGLIPYFKDVFISEELNAQKPSINFFNTVFSRIPYFNKEETAIIGDSLTSDIQGGINAGIDTIWYNPKRKEVKDPVIPTYDIAQLNEIYDL